MLLEKFWKEKLKIKMVEDPGENIMDKKKMHEKVLVSDEEGDIHYVDALDEDYTACGIRLHPISTTHVKDKHEVSCKECQRRNDGSSKTGG